MPIGVGKLLKVNRRPGLAFVVITDNDEFDPTFHFWVRSLAGQWSLAAATFQTHEIAGDGNNDAPVGTDAILIPNGPSLYGGGANEFRSGGATLSPQNCGYKSLDNWAAYSEMSVPSSVFPELDAAFPQTPPNDDPANNAFEFRHFGSFARSTSGRIVTGCNAKFVGAYDTNTNILYSDDVGVTWNPVTIGGSLTDIGQIEAIAYSPSLDCFVAAERATQPRALYSADGITWELAFNDGAIARVARAVTWDGTRFVLVAFGVGATIRIYRSLDGITWDAAITGVSISGEIDAARLANDGGSNIVLAVAGIVGNNNGNIYRSTNGGSSFALELSSTVRSRALKWSPVNSLFYVGRQNGVVLSSPDGDLWTTVTMPSTPTGTRRIVAMAFPDA